MNIEGVEMPQCELIMENWEKTHHHPEEIVKVYLELEIEFRKYQHSHPFNGLDE